METNDDILFDRLVDGELPTKERRQLLASLDDRPGGWRACALAFLEAQTWQQELGRMVVEPAGPVNVSVPSDMSVAGGAKKRIWSWHSANWFVLAASVFIAFSLGLALGDLPHPHQSPAPNPFNSHVAEVAPGRENSALHAATPNDAVTLWVRDEAGRPRSVRVPLVDAAAMDPQMGLQFQSGLPSTVRDQLEQRGYQVESKRRYAPLWLENGRSLVLPVEDTKIVPVSNPVY